MRPLRFRWNAMRKQSFLLTAVGGWFWIVWEIEEAKVKKYCSLVVLKRTMVDNESQKWCLWGLVFIFKDLDQINTSPAFLPTQRLPKWFGCSWNVSITRITNGEWIPRCTAAQLRKGRLFQRKESTKTSEALTQKKITLKSLKATSNTRGKQRLKKKLWKRNQKTKHRATMCKKNPSREFIHANPQKSPASPKS